VAQELKRKGVTLTLPKRAEKLDPFKAYIVVG
jgi:hypothetical protein